MSIEELGKRARDLEEHLSAAELSESAKEFSKITEEYVNDRTTPRQPISHTVDMQQLEQSVAKHAVDQKPYCVAVTITMYYDFPKEAFPEWANGASVANMVEEAFSDYNRPLTLESFDGDGVLGKLPTEISLDRVMEA